MPQSAELRNLAEIEQAIDAIRVEFIQKLDGYLERLETILRENTLAAEIMTAIFISHRIAGVAGTFGYPELGRVARITESDLNAIRSDEGEVNDVSTGAERVRKLSEEVATVCLDYHQQNRMMRPR